MNSDGIIIFPSGNLDGMKKLTTFEEVVAYINDQGFQVNDMSQLADGTWQANVRSFEAKEDGRWHYEYGRHSKPVEALKLAIWNAYYDATKSQMWARQKIIRNNSEPRKTAFVRLVKPVEVGSDLYLQDDTHVGKVTMLLPDQWNARKPK